MLVIVEGVDGTGKTTVVDGLKSYFYCPVYIVKFSNPKTAEMFQDAAFARGEYSAAIRVFKAILEKQPDALIVCDRFYLGEYAYGPVKRNYPEWLAERAFEVEDEIIKTLGVDNVKLVILVAKDINIAVERSNRLGEYLTKVKEYDAVNVRYTIAFTKSKLDADMFMVDKCTPEQVLGRVIRFIVTPRMDRVMGAFPQ